MTLLSCVTTPANSTPADSSLQVCDAMLALKDNCIHPETKKTYIKTGKGGKDNSPEGHQVSHTEAWNTLL